MSNYRIETKCIQSGWEPKNGEPRILPIIQSTTFKYESSDEMGALFDLEKEGYFYSRLQNPTNDYVAKKICDLEGGYAAMLTASGQAANFYAVFNICEAGDHFISTSAIYGGTFNLFGVTMKKLGIDVTFVDPEATEEEIQAVAEALRSGWITTGPRTKEFERNIAQFTGCNRAACLNSATACLETALRLLGIGEGDEVIVPAYTYTASASVVAHVNAKLVLIDVEKDTYHLDYDALEAAINESTKAVIPVDIGGVMVDYDRIRKIVESKKNIFKASTPLQEALGRVAIVADSAHGFGASEGGVMSGMKADFTSFSFHAVKNLTTAEGGALTWRSIPGVDDEDIYKQIMLYSLHGQSKDALAKTKLGAWEYDIKGTYYKCNMTDIMASIGLVQLKRYPGLLKRRRDIIERYTQGIAADDVDIMKHFTDEYTSSGHLYLVRLLGKDVKERNELITRLAEAGVATNVHFKPLPMHTAYKNMGFDIKDFPHSYNMYRNEITLPLHTCLTDEQVEYVIEQFNRMK